MGLYAKTVGALAAVILLGGLGIVLFDRIWYQVGLGAAIAVVCGALLAFAWWTDRKDRAARAGLEDI
jgi:asparagine N-glycosylation enzyme membrane subunit Stt3